MTNNNHKNTDCGYAEALVSHLYGETGAGETAVFEAHLQTCQACADELEAFSGVHFAINDWKLKDFANLQTPAIEIPYEKAEKVVEPSSNNGSWLSALLRDLISLSPRGLTLATASLAVLAVCVGITLIALNSRKDNDVAGTNKNSKPAVVPTVDKTPEPANANQANSQGKESKPLNEQKAPQPEVAVKSESDNKRVVKAVSNQRPTPKVNNTNTPKNNDVRRNNKNNNDVVAPKIIPDEDEDDTLRLAELFEEIDTRD